MLAIHPTPDDVAAAVADQIADAIEHSEWLTIGLAGGSTPAAAYRRLGARSIDWSRTTLWLGDERWVPRQHPESNTGMAERTLGASAASRLLAPDSTLGDPHEAAAAYAVRLRAAFNHAEGGGRPDLLLLGMGDDGHTASLFPGTDALDVSDRPFVANWVPVKDAWRLTATFPLLWSARRLVFIVTGETKAATVTRILEAEEPLPAQRAAAGNPNTTWFLDEAAASLLRKSPR